jgi:hypothetical protein
LKAKLTLILALTLSTLLLITPTRANGVPGDINDDGKVNILDVTLAAGQYLLTSDDPNYNATIVAKADFAEPYGIITILDLVTLISYYTG